MHYKKTFALAGIFLAVAIIVPTVIFSLQAQSDLIIIQNPVGMQTGGNVTLPTPQQVQDSLTPTTSSSFWLLKPYSCRYSL